MERATKRVNNMVVYVGDMCNYKDTGDIAAEVSIAGVRDILKRLADFEDDNEKEIDILNAFFNIRQAVYDYFGFVEDWVIYPFEDYRKHYWKILDGDTVVYGKKRDVINLTGKHYSNTIYTQRFYDKWVYRGEKYTMIFVDTHTDGNKFFGVYDNAKEIKDNPELLEV